VNARLVAANEHLIAANQELIAASQAMQRRHDAVLAAEGEHVDIKETVRRLEGLILELIRRQDGQT
jgi:hypothetical protein